MSNNKPTPNRRAWLVVLASLGAAALVCAVCAGVALFVGMRLLETSPLPSPTATRRAAATTAPQQNPTATAAPARASQTPPATPSATPVVAISATDTQMQLRVFRQLWEAVNTNYV